MGGIDGTIDTPHHAQAMVAIARDGIQSSQFVFPGGKLPLESF